MQNCKNVIYGVFLLSVAILSSFGTQAQVDKKIGTGTGTNTDWTYPCPLPDSKGNSKAQYLYLASELTAAGMTAGNINALKFKVTDLGMYYDASISAIDNLIIKIGTTSTASLTSNTWETGTQVVWGPVNHLCTVGLNEFPFITPFFWNGTDNIVIEICAYKTESQGTANPFVEWTEGLSFNGSHTYGEYATESSCDRTDLDQSYDGGNQTTRPNVTFNWTQALPCSGGSLTGGSAVASIGSLCSGESFRLSLTGATVATGLTYQWQSSSNNSTWNDITGATNAFYATSQTTSTYYRAVVTCAAGGTANAAAVQVLTPTPLSGTYTIDKSAPAGGGNFQSFADAYNFIRCGINGPVVFNVAAGGTYNEQLIFKNIPGASATNTITFNGNGATISYAVTLNKERHIIKLDNADHFVFNDLNVVAASGSNFGYGFQLTNDADSNVINHCTIQTDNNTSSDSYAGIVVGTGGTPIEDGASLCTGNTFTGNTITGGYYGITLVGTTTAPNDGITIHGNTIRDFYGTAIYVSASIGTFIDSNIISRPTRVTSDLPYGGINGVYVGNINTKLTISRNIITNIFGGGNAASNFYGINLSGVTTFAGMENTVSNNLIYNVNGGASVYGLYNLGSSSVNYYYNTISLDGDGSATTAADVTRGFYQANAGGVIFTNNNISVTRTGLCANTAVWYDSPGADIVSDRNNLYVARGTGARQIGSVNGAVQTFLTDWQLATSKDANSVSADPKFTDLANGNLKPTNPSIDNVGNPVAGISTDLATVLRSTTTPDVGAYEFQTPPCAAPAAGTAVFTQNNVCVDTKLSIDLNGNSTGEGQTYQWSSSNASNGTYTLIGGPSTNPTLDITATTTLYYKAEVACGVAKVSTAPVMLTVYQALPPNHYTINKNAPASATNFTSFAAAKGSLDCGISGPIVFDVVAGSGPYNEQLIMTPVKGASAVNTVTFNGNGDTLRYSSTVSTQRAVIKLNDADHIIFDSLYIDAAGTGSYGYGVQFINDADSNIIRRCIINADMTKTTTNYAGIVISPVDNRAVYANGDDPSRCDGNLFEKNIIQGGYYGITVTSSPIYNDEFSEQFIYNNKIINNTIKDFYTYGIYMIGTGGSVIEDNTFSRPTRASVSTFNGIYLSQSIKGGSIARNRIFNPFGGNKASTSAFNGINLNMAGYYLYYDPAVGTTTIANNIIYNVVSNGEQTGINYTSGLNLHIYHNTVSLDDTTSRTASTTSGIKISTAGTANEFINNIITITRGGNGLKYGINFGADKEGIGLNRNDYYVKGAGGNNYVGYRGAGFATIDQWVAVMAKDVNSISANPVYADLAGGNLKPTAAPLENTGMPVGIATDIVAAARSTSTPDIGAYEFAVDPCSARPTPGTASATPNTGICMGTVVKLALAGNSVNGNQTYQWQKATAANGPWENIGDPVYTSDLATRVMSSGYFRCVLTCNNVKDSTAPAQVQLNAPLPGGVYTIKADGTGNYPSFGAAVAAMGCGIGGPVTFNVSPGTYAEQVYMRRIYGASAINRVTFQSANGDASGVVLTAAGTNTANYVLKLDSTDYITYKNISIQATSATNGRVVEIAGTSSFDSLLNNTITTPATTNNNVARAAVYGTSLSGNSIVIKGNTITNGASGIYISGNTINKSNNLSIQENIVKGVYQYGIYSINNSRVGILKNKVTLSGTLNPSAYGVYVSGADTSYQVKGNEVNIENTATTAYGVYATACKAAQGEFSAISANKITAITGNSGSLYGLYVASSTNSRIINNVVNVNTSDNNSYGIYSSSNEGTAVYNNTVSSTSTTSGDNIAGYFEDDYTDTRFVDIRNNIFSNEGGGRAILLSNVDRFYSDYNLLYTIPGAILAEQQYSGQYSTLEDWVANSGMDVNSIVYKPAFVSNLDLQPAISNAEVWAMHGRGVQLDNNDRDINDASRPVALKDGVPDLGAYEFLPSVLPQAAIAIPATPAPGIRQVFMVGTDTVCAITWGAAAPQSITVRRYSGIAPLSLPTGSSYMYFYVDADVTAAGAYEYTIEQKYLDSWRGFIDSETRIRLGRTDAASAWQTDAESTVNTSSNTIAEPALTYLDKITGLTDGRVHYPSTDSTRADTSNMGTRFWVGYGKPDQYGVNSFVIYMGGAEKDADVTVKVNGTPWVKNYHIAAHQFMRSDDIPRTGVYGALLNTEGLSDRGISIESTVPIAAYVHADSWSPVASSMLIPTGAYGMEYYSLAYKQFTYESTPYYNWFYVIADHDSTMVEITPSGLTTGGRKPGVPFVVTLNKGEVYNVMGAMRTPDVTFDLSGSHIRSLSNLGGKCYPIAVFSGNSSAFIDCDSSFVPFGDYLIQQNMPVRTWGTQYLTAPTSASADPATTLVNFYRIQVKDPSTVVKINGVVQTSTENNYYSYQSNKADFIEADKAIAVMQFAPGASNVCDFGGGTRPEMFTVVPINQGIKKASFYRMPGNFGTPYNYLTLIIPTAGLTSLKIDGSSTIDYSYAHPGKPGYTVVVKRWDADQEAVSSVESDSAFTAITYSDDGFSYGYTVGTSVNNVYPNPGITNIYDSTGNYSQYTCVNTPFHFSVKIPAKPTKITWKMSGQAKLVPQQASDIIQSNPVAADTIAVNGKEYYVFSLPDEYHFSETGTYQIPVSYEDMDLENCNHTAEAVLTINVIGAPTADITVNYAGCPGDTAYFTGTGTTTNNVLVNQWKWNLGDNTMDTAKAPKKKYPSPLNDTIYKVTLRVIAADGCIADKEKDVTVKPDAAISLVSDSVTVCRGGDATFAIKTPVAGVTYKWYNVSENGTPAQTGNNATLTNVTAKTYLYIEATNTNGCITRPRDTAIVDILPILTLPVARVDTIGAGMLRFAWTAVAGTKGYEVSIDGGVTWITPSSGTMGLTHTITGLVPGKEVKLQVKAKGEQACQDVISAIVSGTTLLDEVFAANAFTPNGDMLNDEFKIRGAIIKSLRLAIFNQWGQKVFDSNDKEIGWKGDYKGKPQPSGVYMYVANLILQDGSSMTKKGSVNLVR